jgi:hypothetical protein
MSPTGSYSVNCYSFPLPLIISSPAKRFVMWCLASSCSKQEALSSGSIVRKSSLEEIRPVSYVRAI